MDDDTLMHLIISVSIGAFCGFVVHLMLGDDDNNAHKKRKK